MEISTTVILKSSPGPLWAMVIFQGPGGEGGGGVTPDLKWREWLNRGKIKTPPKKSHAEFLSLKNFQKALNDTSRCTLFAELRSQDTRALPRIFRLFWIPPPPKNPYLHQPTQKITCQIFLPIKTFAHPRHLKSRLPPLPDYKALTGKMLVF